MNRNILYSKNIILRIILNILSVIYYVLYRIKFLIFKYKLFPKTRLEISKVISVGNITAGGTGKTPFVIWLVEELKKRGFSVCVVFRSYNSGKKYGKVFDGDKFLMDIDQSGDEPWMIAHNTRVPVYIGKSRAKIALMAEKEYSPDYIVLDDAFQYWRLERDIDVVCVDSKEYFYNRRILPAGIMREPLRCLNRASWVIIKNDSIDKEVDKEIVRDCFHLKENISVMTYEYSTDIEYSPNVLAIAGIAKPQSFFDSVSKILKYEKLYYIGFDDHEIYSQKKISFIRDFVKEKNISDIVCTEKDYYKLSNSFKNIYFLRINIKVSEKERFFEYIKNTYNTG